MDSKYLEGLLQTLTQSEESIKKTANYCSSYPESAGLAAFMIEQELLTSRKDRKKLYLFLIHEIILDEKAKKRVEVPFIKTFGGKLKTIFQEYSGCVDDMQDMEKGYTIIRRWEKDQIYHPSFLDKLRNIMQPKFDLLKQQYETFNALNQKDASAHKVLQHNISIVQQHEQSQQIYNYLKHLSDIDQKTLEFNCNFDKIQAISSSDLSLMIDQGEQCRQQLITSVCQLQDYYKSVAQQGEILLQEYNYNENNIHYYKEQRNQVSK